ncbi:hypothetical protein [Lysobacter gummosus]|uniref:hypothetical protein n=1 Tax=Lysobacter gummosus TaxID=262324 RepID=UPI003624BCA4
MQMRSPRSIGYMKRERRQRCFPRSVHTSACIFIRRSSGFPSRRRRVRSGRSA